MKEKNNQHPEEKETEKTSSILKKISELSVKTKVLVGTAAAVSVATVITVALLLGGNKDYGNINGDNNGGGSESNNQSDIGMGESNSSTTKKYSKGLEFYSNGDGTCSVKGIGTCTDKNIIIPSISPNGERVTTIGGLAYSNIDSIEIPYSVTDISREAFKGCSNLKNIKIPDSIKNIGKDAFNNCGYYNDEKNWENGVLYIGNHLIASNDTVTGRYFVKQGTVTIADYAFYKCKDLLSIEFSNSVKNIGKETFRDCENLSNVIFSNNLLNIGIYAFYNCSKLSDIVLPSTVESIGGSAFYNTGYFNSWSNWEDNLLYIGDWLIAAHPNSSKDCYIKNGTKFLANYAFNDCKFVKNVVIPNSVISIGEDCFYSCDSLASVTFEDGSQLKYIGYEAFYYCDKLRSITIPESVTNISNCAFLTRVDLDLMVDKNNKVYKSENGILYSKDGSILIRCAKKSISNFVVPEGVKIIDVGAFEFCDGLTNINIADSVTSISDSAFCGCGNLANIIIPKSVTDIGPLAFYLCYLLNDVYFEGSEVDWKEIDIGEYNDCLTNATIHFNYVPEN